MNPNIREYELQIDSYKECGSPSYGQENSAIARAIIYGCLMIAKAIIWAAVINRSGNK